MNPNDTPEPIAQVSAETAVESKDAAPTRFATLSRRIQSRTTDLLAVAIVVVGGVTIGSQFAGWWATDEDDLGPQWAANTNLNWGAGDTPVSLEFGDQPFQLERHAIRGDRDTAFSRLIEKCAGAAAQTQSVSTTLLPAEQKLLGLLQRQTPVREQPGVWRIYRIERPMTLVIATRTFDRLVDSAGIANDASVSKPQPDRPNRRVVCWGMAQPNQEDVWVLFTMRPTAVAAKPRPESGQVELPNGARKILSLRDASGGALTAFEGDAIPMEWKLWFNDWFARRGWTTSLPWVESPVGWSAVFVPTEDNVTGRIDISFSPAGENRLSGMISVTTPAGATKTEILQEGFHR